MRKLKTAFAIAGLSVAIATPFAVNAANDGDNVYVYCIGNTASRDYPMQVYISDVFSHRLDVMNGSIRTATADFREDVRAIYDDPIGATCHHFDSWDIAEDERDATIRHRRNNGFSVSYVD